MLDSVADPGLDANISESRLGSWYFGVGQELSAHLVFADIEQPLREVHASGRLFLKQLTSGISAQELDHSMADIDLQIGHLIGLLHRLERLLLTRRATCKNQ